MPIAVLIYVGFLATITGDTKPKLGQPMSLEDQYPERDFKGITYTGFVTSITLTEITIQRIGRNPRRFPFSDFLKNGGCHSHDAAFMCKIKHIDHGDIVQVQYDRKERVEICQYLCIFGRPSGRVPPSRQSRGDLIQWHEMANSWQDLEMHGIPIPEKLRPPRFLTEAELQQIHNSGNPPPNRIPEPLVVRK